MFIRRSNIALATLLFFLFARIVYTYGVSDKPVRVPEFLRDSVYAVVTSYKDLVDADVIENFQKTELDFFLQGPQPFHPNLFEEDWNSALSEKKRIILGEDQQDSVYIMAYGADAKPALRYNFVLERWNTFS